MKHVLVELVMHWLDIGMSVGLNLDKPKLNFLFAKFRFGMNGKDQGTLAVLKASEGAGKLM